MSRWPKGVIYPGFRTKPISDLDIITKVDFTRKPCYNHPCCTICNYPKILANDVTMIEQNFEGKTLAKIEALSEIKEKEQPEQK